jgi:hypothetical protein
VSGSGDKTVQIWDAHSGAELAVLRGHEGAVRSVAFSAGGDFIVSDSKDGTVRVWDAQTGRCLEVINGYGDIAAILAVWGRKSGAKQFGCRQTNERLETVIQSGEGERPFAWFPVILGAHATHPLGHAWAGSWGNHLHLITLEGGPKFPDSSPVERSIDTQRQHEALKSYNAGRMLAAQGELSGALAAYRQSLAIAQLVSGEHPTNAQWQRNLSICHAKIGDTLFALGQDSEGLAPYRQSLAIIQFLSAQDPTNPQWRRDLRLTQRHILKSLFFSRTMRFLVAYSAAILLGAMAGVWRQSWFWGFVGPIVSVAIVMAFDIVCHSVPMLVWKLCHGAAGKKKA